MSNILNNALTGLQAAQAGLRTTANNTANINTDGYSRQRIDQVALPGQSLGKITLGNGVVVDGVDRIYDRFLVDQLRESNALEQRHSAFNELAGRIDGVLGATEFGVSPALQNFFDQLQTVSHDATSIVNRQLLISQGISLEDRIHQFQDQLDGVDSEINRRVTDFVSSINSSAQSLARLNDQIVAASDRVSGDMLDQRDRLLTSLSELIDIRATEAPDGSINVLVGSGRPLVLSTTSFQLETVVDQFDPRRLQVAHVVGNSSSPITKQIGGGALGGLLAFRQEALDPAKRNLGMVAFGLTEAFNTQHQRGLDLNGNLGGNFFRPSTPQVTSSTSNAGTAVMTAIISDPTAVAAKDYILRFDGAAWQLNDAATGNLLSMTGTGAVGDPFVVDGLEITVSAGAVADDQFLIQSVSEAASSFAMEITDPAAIAAANPLTSGLSQANIGDGAITPVVVDDSTNAALLQPVDIVFDDATTYRIFDSVGTDLTGPLAYTNGGDISFNGWRVQISGSPVAGDAFNIGPNIAGSGDNGNMIELAGVRTTGYLDGGFTSINDTIGNMIAAVGGAAQQSAQNLSAQSTLRQQLEIDVQNVSGVNLDEEAVNALRYQEAFMASSRLIAMADELFDAVLRAVG